LVQQRRGLRLRVLSLHTLKPLDEPAVLGAARETGAVFTVEEHSRVGGLGSAVAELLAEAGVGVRFFRRLALPDRFVQAVGDQAYLRGLLGLDAEGIARTVLEALGGRPGPASGERDVEAP
jgi:transketolase